MAKEIETELSEEDFKFVQELADNKEANINSDTIREMLNMGEQIGKAYIQQLPLELALVKLTVGNQ
jgi:hypothetical protein